MIWKGEGELGKGRDAAAYVLIPLAEFFAREFGGLRDARGYPEDAFCHVLFACFRGRDGEGCKMVSGKR